MSRRVWEAAAVQFGSTLMFIRSERIFQSTYLEVLASGWQPFVVVVFKSSIPDFACHCREIQIHFQRRHECEYWIVLSR